MSARHDQDGDYVSETTEKQSSPTDENDKLAVPLARFAVLCLSVYLGLFLAMMDTSIVATSLYIIGVEFNDLANVNWVALSYALAYMGCAVAFSRASDIIGRRNSFAIAYVLFIAFSLACGWARNMQQLIAFRAVQGVGGSGLYSVSMIMMPEISPNPKHVGPAIGLVVALGGVLGPVLGGLLTNYTTWRWIFWLNGPVGSFALALFLLSWPQEKHRPVVHKHTWRQLDYLGCFLTIAAAVLVVFAFQDAGVTSWDAAQGNNWSSAVFIAPLVCGIAGWAMLLSWEYLIEHRYAEKFVPVFPLRLFRSGIYAAGVLNTLLLGFPYLLLIYVVPLRIQIVGGKSALLAGVMLLPMLAAVAVGSIASSSLNSKNQKIMETLLVGSCFMLLGCGLLTMLPEDELDMAKLLGFITFCGLGFGLTVSSSTMIAIFEIPAKDYASAQGILAQLRMFGGSLGIAASTAIFRAKMNGAPTLVVRDDDGRALEAEKQLTRIRYGEAFKSDMLMVTIISSMAVVVSLVALLQSRRRATNTQ
ncbi:hypothetical protein QQS21_005129 [Conoideocrella luteorostrata]|uniref:Major facilitator superfamily (MFS) profile domain-containing protein n=1 Tax=Conoideocrella luteorostrata TaxID=1105319 RepID=A0AAJ0CT10_9HYPO|nr:hypothetical protein QQS21_005129 [Conoideocrella luteorostrata]